MKTGAKYWGSWLVALMALPLWAAATDVAASESAESEASNTVVVEAKAASEIFIYPTVKAQAITHALKDSQLSSELNAVVSDIRVVTGDSVKAGQVLLQLDCTDYELEQQRLAALSEQLRAQLSLANYQYERGQKLIKSSSISEELLEQQKAAVLSLSGQLKANESLRARAKRNVARCDIRAPFEGVITDRLVDEGEQLQPGQVVLSLLNTQALELDVQLPLSVAGKLDAYQAVFQAQEKTYPVELRRVLPVVETRARHQKARFSFTGEKPLPGTPGELVLRHKRPHIPAQLLVKRNGQLGLFLLQRLNDRFYAKFSVNPDALPGRDAISHIPAKSQVITQGRFGLSDGQRVTLSNSPARAASSNTER